MKNLARRRAGSKRVRKIVDELQKPAKEKNPAADRGHFV